MRQIEALSELDKSKNSFIYEPYEADSDPNAWMNKQVQLSNFARLSFISELTGKDLENSSVLDVGCGTGDFSGWLKNKKIGSYTGVDIRPSVLALARLTYPKSNFLERDILKDPLDEEFDYSFASGTFATAFDEANNYDFMGSMLHKMSEVTRSGISFNFQPRSFSDDTEKLNEGYIFYYCPQRVLSICSSLPNIKKVVRVSSGPPIQETFYLIK